MTSKKTTEKYFDGEEYWETPSLAWIHRIRREMEEERAAGKLKPISSSELKKMASKFGMRILKPQKPVPFNRVKH